MFHLRTPLELIHAGQNSWTNLCAKLDRKQIITIGQDWSLNWQRAHMIIDLLPKVLIYFQVAAELHIEDWAKEHHAYSVDCAADQHLCSFMYTTTVLWSISSLKRQWTAGTWVIQWNWKEAFATGVDIQWGPKVWDRKFHESYPFCWSTCSDNMLTDLIND